MHVFIVADNLMPGGAEWFMLRKYRELRNAGHKVEILVLQGDKIDQRLLGQFNELKPKYAPLLLVKPLSFLDRVLNKLFGIRILLNICNVIWLRKQLKLHKPDLIHSHLLPADYISVEANRNIKIRHLITVHGDYIAHIKKDEKRVLPKIGKVLGTVQKIVFISDEQREVLIKKYPIIKNKIVKIYNGYDLATESKVAIRKDKPFTYGMIARGLPDKGWQIAIDAFSRIKAKNVQLLLYGESPYLEGLKKSNTDPRITFAGFTNKPKEAVEQFDLGLFPSYYPSESLPTTIIEYLALHKPVLTTSVGECRNMIEHNGEFAGAIIPMNNGMPDICVLQQLMETFEKDKKVYEESSLVAEKAKLKFDMNYCISQYLTLYKELVY